MLTTNQICWVAGILEGEGCFALTNNNRSFYLQFCSTDLDVVEKFKNVVDKSISINMTPGNTNSRPNCKDYYTARVSGSKAIQWMMTIYCLMGVRRKAKIRECLKNWKNVELDSRYINSPKAKVRASLTRKLKSNGFSENEVRLASNMNRMGLTDEAIVEKLLYFRSLLKQESSKNIQ